MGQQWTSVETAPGNRNAAGRTSRRREGLRIAILNVKYSPNLGDGLLSECLEAELSTLIPGLEIESIDLAGRLDYSVGSPLRASALAMLHGSPLLLRQTMAKTLLGPKLTYELRPRWRDILYCVDAAIVGGGNLLGDADLNFPLKLSAALAEVRAAGCPVGVFAVGASDNWSPTGAALFREAFSEIDLYFASVREPRSADIWQRRLVPMGLPRAKVVHDPGLLTSFHFARDQRRAERPSVGIGVMNPVAVAYHTGGARVARKTQAAWYVELAKGCLSRGWHPVFFTNGSPEDEAFLTSLRPALARAGRTDRIEIAPRSKNPAELAGLISSFDLMMAHRLHANIAAYSYGIPQIGFSWDVKLAAFLAQVGRQHCLVTAGVDPVDDVLVLASSELDEGIDGGTHATVLAEARRHVADLAAAMQRVASTAPVAIEAARRTMGG